AILDPSAYFAGANKYLAQLADSSRVKRVTTFRNTVELSLNHVTHYARVAYGKLVKLLSDAGVCADQIVEDLTIGVEGLPRRLRLARHEDVLSMAALAPPASNAYSGALLN